jgi:hypothetical protein
MAPAWRPRPGLAVYGQQVVSPAFFSFDPPHMFLAISFIFSPQPSLIVSQHLAIIWAMSGQQAVLGPFSAAASSVFRWFSVVIRITPFLA